MRKLLLTVPVVFGLEALVATEIRDLGYETTTVEDGKVTFEGDLEAICASNLHLRTGERVLIKIGEFPAHTFDELFEGVKKLPWEEWIGKDDAFPVKGYSLKSALHSIPDCQAIVKRAVVERLKQTYHIDWFEETGSKYQIQFSIMKDSAILYLDTSGDSLYKRGYREKGNDAPIRETLAAALIILSRWQGDNRPLYDPMCGSGTLAIEAAMLAANIAPGLKRHFAAERWHTVPKALWQKARQAAKENINKNAAPLIYASDIDPKSVKLAKENAQKAGVDSFIQFSCQDINNLTPYQEKCTIVCNPPYGERLMDKKSCETLYAQMGKKFSEFPFAGCYIITSHEQFEDHFGKKADKKRKIYNGMLKCYLYQYFKTVKP